MRLANDFIFVVTAHKSLHLAEKCLKSLKWQVGGFQNTIIYADDNSSYDPTDQERLANLVKEVNGRVLFFSTRNYQLGTLSQVIPKIGSPQSIICLVDGDDYLLPDALQTLAKAYSNRQIAMTYGNVLIDFRPYQDPQATYFSDKSTVNTLYSAPVWKNCSFREDGFRCFHLRSFRRWLWDLIDPRHFLRPNGEYFHASGDSAYLFPMLEMLADPHHVAFIEEPIYVYRLHPGNVHHSDKPSQTNDLEYIRFKLPKYPPLDRKALSNLLASGQ
jgi:glycosyltransferase involved in cell wall biosynthesis